MENVVNIHWLKEFLSSTYWDADLDDHPLNSLNMENENSRAYVVSEYLFPAWCELSPTQQRMVKDTFRYGLNSYSRNEWQWITHYSFPDITRVPEEFFTDIWGRLFPGEQWHLKTTDGYKRIDDNTISLHQPRFKYSR